MLVHKVETSYGGWEGAGAAVVIPFLTEHFANWSRKSSCAGSQRYRAVLGIVLEAREAERLFVFFWVGSQRSCPILGVPCLAREKKGSVL